MGVTLILRRAYTAGYGTVTTMERACRTPGPRGSECSCGQFSSACVQMDDCRWTLRLIGFWECVSRNRRSVLALRWLAVG